MGFVPIRTYIIVNECSMPVYVITREGYSLDRSWSRHSEFTIINKMIYGWNYWNLNNVLNILRSSCLKRFLTVFHKMYPISFTWIYYTNITIYWYYRICVWIIIYFYKMHFIIFCYMLWSICRFFVPAFALLSLRNLMKSRTEDWINV